jgi:DMSO/TMAO reductase YedYZ molybdopterin-dependent catalytic subunit
MADATQTSTPSRDDLVVLATQPLVAETRLAEQRGPLTPNPRFFIRDHYNVPRLDPASWRLTIGGTVQNPRTLTLDDLRTLPGRELAATLECAGNARV